MRSRRPTPPPTLYPPNSNDEKLFWSKCTCWKCPRVTTLSRLLTVVSRPIDVPSEKEPTRMYGTPTNCSSSVVGDCCASADTENVFRLDSRRLNVTPPCWSKLLRSLDRWYIRNAPS